MPETLSGMSDSPSTNPMAAASALTSGRPKYQFKIPPNEMSWPTDPSTIVMREITIAEESLAMAASQGDQMRYAQECLKHSIVSADGRAISWDNAGKETFLEGCSPKVRDLLMRAHNKLHITRKEAAEDFLSGMTVIL